MDFIKDLFCAKHSESARWRVGHLNRAEKNLVKTPRLPSYRPTPTYQEAPPPPSLIGLEEGAAQCEPIKTPLQGIRHPNRPPGGQREVAWENVNEDPEKAAFF